jgi:hypothetical protein
MWCTTWPNGLVGRGIIMINLRRLATTLALGLAAAAATTATSAAPAQAEETDPDWTWYQSGSRNNIAYAAYDRDTHKLRVDDQEADGHAVFAYLDGPGWDNHRCWYTGGWQGPGGTCSRAALGGGGANYDVYLCTGEWSTKEEIDCSDYLGGFYM